MAKRKLTKEKLDKQLTGQTSTSPFMGIRDGTERKVSFNARDELGNKIDKLTVMMDRLAARDSNDKRPFKPQIYKSRGSYPHSQNRNYNQRNYQAVDTEDNMDEEVIGPDINKITGGTVFKKKTLGDMEDKIVEENIEMIGMMVTIEVGTYQEKGYFQEIIAIIGIEIQIIPD